MSEPVRDHETDEVGIGGPVQRMNSVEEMVASEREAVNEVHNFFYITPDTPALVFIYYLQSMVLSGRCILISYPT